MNATINRFEDVNVLLALDEVTYVQALTDQLAQIGFTQVRLVSCFDDMQAALNTGGVDLLIGGLDLPGGRLTDAMSRIRHGHLGDNPFLCAVALIYQSQQDDVHHAIDAGFDDLYLMPMAPIQFITRLATLARNRRPFVVTSDYIGPDRRTAVRPGTMTVPQVKVPNPIALRSGGQSRARMAKLNDQIYSAINAQKVERQLYQLAWLKDRLEPMLGDDTLELEPDFRASLTRLAAVAVDLKERIGSTGRMHQKAMCMTLASQVIQMMAAAIPARDDRWAMVMRLIDTLTRNADHLQTA